MNPEVEIKLRELQSGDATLRLEALQALGRLGDDDAIPLLVETLHDTDRWVREYARQAIGMILAGPRPNIQDALDQKYQSMHTSIPTSTHELLKILQTANGIVPENVIEALGRIGPSVVPDLLELLQHPSGLVRAAAAEALGRIAATAAIPALLKLLQDSDSFTRQCAVDALARYGPPIVPVLLEALRDKRSRKDAVNALGKVADASVTPALLQAMQSADWAFQFDCCRAFQMIGLSTRPYLREALKDPYEFTRASAATALGMVGDSSDVPVLLEVLQDPGRFGHVRSKAAYALGYIEDKSAIPALIEALKDRHEIVRASVVEALGAFKDAEIVPPLIQLLGDTNIILRQRVLDVLVAQGHAAISALEGALLETNEAIHLGAATALLRSHPDTDLPHRLLLLPNATAVEIASALKALEKANYPLPAPEVLCRSLMDDQDPKVRQAAIDILSILKPGGAPPTSRSSSRFWQWKRR